MTWHAVWDLEVDEGMACDADARGRRGGRRKEEAEAHPLSVSRLFKQVYPG